MEFESLLSEIDKLQEELSSFDTEINAMSKKAFTMFNIFLDKVFAVNMNTDDVRTIKDADYNNTKQNPTNTEVGQIPIVDKVNNKQIPYEESIINEVK